MEQMAVETPWAFTSLLEVPPTPAHEVDIRSNSWLVDAVLDFAMRYAACYLVVLRRFLRCRKIEYDSRKAFVTNNMLFLPTSAGPMMWQKNRTALRRKLDIFSFSHVFIPLSHRKYVSAYVL